MTRTAFLRALRDHRACADGYGWAVAHKAVTSPADAWALLPRADWMLWLLHNFGATWDRDALQEWAYGVADRALRIHAVAALREQGLDTEADRLAALPPIIDRATARAAYDVAADAAYAAYDVAADAADEAYAAYAVAYAAYDAAYVAYAVAYAADDAAYAAYDVAADAADEAEQQLQVDTLRAALTPVWPS